MNIRRTILVTLLGATLLLGLVPYQSLYCRLMQRSIDGHMLQCCMKQQAANDSRTTRNVVSSTKMQVLEKPIIGVFEKNHRADQAAVDYCINKNFDQPIRPQKIRKLPVGEQQFSPPDLVLLNLNLRI